MAEIARQRVRTAGVGYRAGKAAAVQRTDGCRMEAGKVWGEMVRYGIECEVEKAGKDIPDAS